jgi:soluble lytic murein transglycosylase-like protein
MAETNKIVYICFIFATMLLAASPVRAAETGSPDRKAMIVRADPKTGKLVRSEISAPPAARDTQPQPQISEIVDKAAKAHHVDPLLVHSVIKTESNYNPYAVSRKGAEGLMQLAPGTARMLGVTNSFDPQQNIEAGVKYLKYLQDLYKDDQLALAAYNAGPGAVEKYKQVPPYPETQNYVKQVGKRYSTAKAAQQQQAPKAIAAPPPPPEHPKLEQYIDENGRLYLRTAN